MLEPQQIAQQEQAQRETLFIQRYERLLAWALRLTNQHLQSAEDLVQDAFIQFVLGRTSVEEIDNIDGYLRRMLRYMHLARITRSDQKAVDTAISLTDYDALDLGWSNIDPSRRMQAQEELWQICSYACSRKEKSRTGAVLILRFFHNYLPAEIAQLLCASRHNVDQWQNLARRELKQFLNSERGNLRLMNARKKPSRTFEGESIENLREIIFASRKGDCLFRSQLEAIYLDTAEQVTTAQVAHLVSCRTCLDETNQILHLPLLAERYLSESGRSTPPKPPSTGGSSSDEPPSDFRSRLEKRLRDVVEHKPKQLRVAVNGSVVGSTKVGLTDNEFDLHLDQDASVEFVEILSEQDIQLLFVVPPSPLHPSGSFWAKMNLSDRRELALRLDLGTQRTLHVQYFQPPLPSPALTQDTKPARLLSLVRPGEADSIRIRKTVWYTPLLRFFKDRVQEQNEPPAGVMALTERFGSGKPIWSRPILLLLPLALIALLAIVLLTRDPERRPTAPDLLNRAAASESRTAGSKASTAHRVIAYEEHRSSGVARLYQLEIWEDDTQHQLAMRLFDRQGNLVAGAWKRADGKRFLLHHSGRLEPELTSLSFLQLIQSPADIWRAELSAKEFLKLGDGLKVARVEETAQSYVITFEVAGDLASQGLIKATIELRRADLHAIKQTFVFRKGDETIEYRFTEKFSESLPNPDVQPSVFQPEERTQKLSGNAKPAVENRGQVTLPVTPLAPASPELEIDVAYLLAKAKSDRAEQLSLSRTANGQLLVEGVVDSRTRKDEILGVLAPIRNHPAVTLNIIAIDELPSTQPNTESSKTVSPQSLVSDETVAVDRELRTFLTSGNPGLKNEELDEAVRTFSARVVNRSYTLVFRAVELKRLFSRLEKVDPASVSTETRNKWLLLLHDHASALEREARALREELRPALFSDTALNKVADNNDPLATQVTTVHSLVVECNDLIRSAFTISSDRSTRVKSPNFLHSLLRIEVLSGRIKNSS